jgi:leucyl/phenylalanyl-tRNA---protein transferase
MPHIILDETAFYFPPVEEADEEGLLLIGGKVSPERVIEAYSKGIFPWYNDDSLPLWWSPDPRFVLFPDEMHVSRSMKKFLQKTPFEFKMNTAFEEIISNCAAVDRKGQAGTWITDEMAQVYIHLHQKGYAQCAETWVNDKLVGGMYGIRLGNVFFGESMFSIVTNASKFAFVHFIKALQNDGVELMDCQVYTEHVESLGGRLIDRKDYLNLLLDLVGSPAPLKTKT